MIGCDNGPEVSARKRTVSAVRASSHLKARGPQGTRNDGPSSFDRRGPWVYQRLLRGLLGDRPTPAQTRRRGLGRTRRAWMEAPETDGWAAFKVADNGWEAKRLDQHVRRSHADEACTG